MHVPRAHRSRANNNARVFILNKTFILPIMSQAKRKRLTDLVAPFPRSTVVAVGQQQQNEAFVEIEQTKVGPPPRKRTKQTVVPDKPHKVVAKPTPSPVTTVVNRKSKVAAANAAAELSLQDAADAERLRIQSEIDAEVLRYEAWVCVLKQDKIKADAISEFAEETPTPLNRTHLKRARCLAMQIASVEELIRTADTRKDKFASLLQSYETIYNSVRDFPESVASIIAPMLQLKQNIFVVPDDTLVSMTMATSMSDCVFVTQEQRTSVYIQKLNKITTAINHIILSTIVEDFRSACRGETCLGPVECIKYAYTNFVQLHTQHDSGPFSLATTMSEQARPQIEEIAASTGTAATSLILNTACVGSSFDRVDICSECAVPLLFITSQSKLVCPVCGRSEVYLDSMNAITVFSKDTDNTSPYKRINHLDDNLMCMQAKEIKVVPKSVILKIMYVLFKDAGTDQDKILARREALAEDDIRVALKILNLRRYYDNVPQIFMKITQKKPPQMTASQEDRVRHRFRVIQGPFAVHCPPSRKNFLPYFYIIYKICEMEYWHAFLPRCRLPKGKDKRIQADEIWEKMCNDLRNQDPAMPWFFFRTPPPPPPLPPKD